MTAMIIMTALTMAMPAPGRDTANAAAIQDNYSMPYSAAKKPKASPMQPADGVKNLPFARGKTFKTLDTYLAHLEELGAIDLPWWREVKPGVYERVTNMPDAERETATRAQLMERFGFSE